MDLLRDAYKVFVYYLILNICITPSVLANEILKDSVLNAWKDAGYFNPSISFFDSYLYTSSDEGEFTHGLELDVVVLRGSGWDKDTIKKRVKLLAGIYKQCRLKFEHVKLVELDPPSDGRLDFFPWYRNNLGNEEEKGRSTYSFARLYPHSGELFSITYIRSFTNDEAGSSGPIWYVGLESPMLYKQFISLISNSEDYKKKRPLGYSTEAHELGHALFESTHVGRDNIMALTSRKRTPKIRKDHCEIALEHELVRGL